MLILICLLLQYSGRKCHSVTYMVNMVHSRGVLAVAGGGAAADTAAAGFQVKLNNFPVAVNMECGVIVVRIDACIRSNPHCFASCRATLKACLRK